MDRDFLEVTITFSTEAQITSHRTAHYVQSYPAKYDLVSPPQFDGPSCYPIDAANCAKFGFVGELFKRLEHIDVEIICRPGPARREDTVL
jgi:hypothetical protein